MACELKKISNKEIILCGDASEAVLNAVCGQSNIKLSAPLTRLHNAVGVGLYANDAINEDNYSDPSELNPFYLKLPQAERELKEKQEKGEVL